MCVGREVEVPLFGKKVKAVCVDGCVMFERKSFVSALGKPRAERIFSELNDITAFLGPDGTEELISSGKEHLLCGLVLADKRASEELVSYANAWISAYELLRGEE